MKPASLIDAALEKLKGQRGYLSDEIAAAERALEVSRAKICALDFAIAALASDPEPEKPAEKRQPPGAVERAIRALLGEGRQQSADWIAEKSMQKPASVAAALRRMVATGAVDKVGELYRMHRAETQEAAE